MLDRATQLASSEGGVSRRDILKYAGLGAALFGAAPVLAACGSSGSKTSANGSSTSAAKATSFRIATALGDNFIIDAVNQAQHQYAPHHLAVPKFLYPSSGVQGMQLLAAGAADGEVQDTLLTLATFANSQKGKRPVIVGMRVPENTYSIVVKKGSWPDASASFADKMKALKGKRVGVTAVGAGADKQLALALKAAGMSYNDVTHLSIGQVTPAIAQMRAGRIDAYVGFTRATARFLAQLTGGSVLIDFADPAVPAVLSKQQVDVCVVSEDFANTKQAVVKDWLAAQWDGKDWILANRQAAADLLNTGSFNGKGAQVCSEYIDHFANALVPKLQPMWAVTRDSIDFMIDLAVGAGAIKSGSVSYEQIVPAFARAGGS
jgi:ABC-type nitrate/sulfonate/bicarbonate transport system substrate-binding protein